MSSLYYHTGNYCYAEEENKRGSNEIILFIKLLLGEHCVQ